ncbi:type 3 dihydrofolate reductase [Planctobacterium marinum]|uniref:type 3 dihydrofolate reductase n=1 Tax=Planctobacterium marinum TaxID=1631968 RepID=UPI001E4E5E1F|nr:type 3 dihydrofolate reductase [Planctobacterium marinum]MCC2605121.1 type 3 dihydrofolate reductase [Planctobacterium marinum]
MKISMIAAMAHNRVIGADNQMPWHLPADLKHFKAVTLGKPVIMGRKTFESIGRPLPGRLNIVISRSGFAAEGVTVVSTPQLALEAADAAEEVMIIGGGVIYDLFLEQADCLYLTFIDLDVAGDTQFPDYQQVATWCEVEKQSHSPDNKNPYNYQFVTLQRHRD